MTEILNCGLSRNSFDRFGGDLNEQILQYLQFTDKIRLECVSRQWKQAIFAKQFDLEIKSKSRDGMTKYSNSNKLPANKLMAYYDCSKVPELNGVTVIQRLLDKCPNISHIVIGTVFQKKNTISYNHLICIIADHCKRLHTLEYIIREPNPDLSSITWDYFCKKQGKSIKHFYNFGTLYDHDIEKKLLRYFDNCLCVINTSLKHLIANDKVLMPKLAEFIGFDCERKDLMALFVERYKNTISSFRTFFNSSTGNIIDFIQQLSQLTNLDCLHLIIRDVDFKVFNKCFLVLVKNLKLLKHLELELNVYNNTVDRSCLIKFLNLINNCSLLTYLKLEITESAFEKQRSSLRDVLLCDLVKSCTLLSRLRFKMYRIDDCLFTDIEKWFPKLKWIDISAYNINLTDIAMKSLTKLEQLKRLEIYGKSCITDCGVCDLIEKCMQFNSLTFESCDYIHIHTVYKMIEIAIKRPKFKFYHRLLGSKNEVIDCIDINKIYFPPNLEIKYDL